MKEYGACAICGDRTTPRGLLCRTHEVEDQLERGEWVNPLVCVCPEPDADPRRDFGMCGRCFRKPLALLRLPEAVQ